ncbi:MAG TPA: hypothetical protein VF126_10895 [Acidobacteriaceae bacterium]
MTSGQQGTANQIDSGALASPRYTRPDGCVDPVVGDILSSWRYDISGITPAMRGDYEDHFSECAYCRGRQRLHRTIDVVLIGTTTISTAAFILALAIIHHIQPLQHWALVSLHLWDVSVMLTLQAAAIVGLLLSLLSWLLVAIATPAPMFLTGVAINQARSFHARTLDDRDSRVA